MQMQDLEKCIARTVLLFASGDARPAAELAIRSKEKIEVYYTATSVTVRLRYDVVKVP